MRKEERRADLVTMAKRKLEEPGELEINDDAEVSEGGDNGCYVQAWVWLDFAGTAYDKEEESD